jgi:hypothetical protein
MKRTTTVTYVSSRRNNHSSCNVRTSTHMRTNTHKNVHTNTCRHAHIHTYIHTHSCTHGTACVHAFSRSDRDTQIHKVIRTNTLRTHTAIYIYAHTSMHEHYLANPCTKNQHARNTCVHDGGEREGHFPSNAVLRLTRTHGPHCRSNCHSCSHARIHTPFTHTHTHATTSRTRRERPVVRQTASVSEDGRITSRDQSHFEWCMVQIEFRREPLLHARYELSK